MSNPFEPPSVSVGVAVPGGGPDFDIGQAFRDGWHAMSRNLGVWLLVMIVGGLASVGSFVACILPALLVVPVLSWGSTRFTLDALDGQADLGTLFSGFGRVGEVWGPMVGTGLLWMLAMLPGLVVSGVVQFGPALLPNQDDLGVQMLVLVGAVVGNFLSRGWDIVVVSRFSPVLFLVVERGMPPLDAFGESWRLTSSCWGKTMAFSLGALFLPLVGVLVCCVGVIPAAFMVTAAQASMYRQLVAPRGPA